jgi:putative oxidoreductase
METLMDFGARALLASPFLASALDKTRRPGVARAEIRRLAGRAGMHPPVTAAFLALLAFQWSGGLLLLHPVTAPLGAIVLIIFLLPVTVLAHSFWTFPAGERTAKRDRFFANVAVAGGLTIVATGALQ